MDIDGSSRAPVDAIGGARQEILIDQVTPQRAVVVGDALEHLVDGLLQVKAPGLERLGHLVKKLAAPRAPDRHDRDPAVADEGTELLGRISEDSNHKNSMNRTCPPAHLRYGRYGQRAGQTVAFRG